MFEFIKRLFGGSSASSLARRGPGSLDVQELARRLGVREPELRRIHVAYHEFYLPKRTGGTRRILAPAPELKAMQRRILHRLLRALRAHPCATGFERGHSIVTNAIPHVGQEIVIKLDLMQFFASTSAERVERYFHAIGWNAEAAALLVQMCTHDGALPQGAATSPRLSNLVNVRLDARMTALARRYGMSYTRYADDLTFSGLAQISRTFAPGYAAPARVNDLILRVKQIVADEGYTLHTDKKLRIARRHDRQLVTGLVVNEKVQLPRATRRRLRAIRHRMATRGAATLTAEQLAGWDALEQMITPTPQ